MSMTTLIYWVVGVDLGALLLLTAYMFVWVKLKARGKVAVIFFETRRIYSMLLSEDSVNNCVWRGKDDDPNREKYKLVPDKVFDLRWPSGFPWYMQERLRAWMFTRNNDEPWDPTNARVVMSARMNRMISDENLLKTMWRDLRISVGAAGVSGGPISMRLLLFIGFGVLVSAIGAVMTYQVSRNLGTIYKLLLDCYHLLGGQ